MFNPEVMPLMRIGYVVHQLPDSPATGAVGTLQCFFGKWGCQLAVLGGQFPKLLDPAT